MALGHRDIPSRRCSVSHAQASERIWSNADDEVTNLISATEQAVERHPDGDADVPDSASGASTTRCSPTQP
jgi:hypothetical protein